MPANLRKAVDQIKFMETHSRRTVGDNIVVLARFKMPGGLSDKEKGQKVIEYEGTLVGGIYRRVLERLVEKRGPAICRKVDLSKMYIPVDPKKTPLRIAWTMRVGCHKSVESDLVEALLATMDEVPMESVSNSKPAVKKRSFMDGVPKDAY